MLDKIKKSFPRELIVSIQGIRDKVKSQKAKQNHKSRNKSLPGHHSFLEPPTVIEQITLSGRAQPGYWSKISIKEAKKAPLTSLTITVIFASGFLYFQLIGSDPTLFGRITTATFTVLCSIGTVSQYRYVRVAKSKQLRKEIDHRRKH